MLLMCDLFSFNEANIKAYFDLIDNIGIFLASGIQLETWDHLETFCSDPPDLCV